MADAKPVIRAARLSDADAITALQALPGVRHGTLARPFPDPDRIRKMLENLPPGDLFIVADTGAVIGSALLRRKPVARLGHCADLIISVHDDYRGQGVGTALFGALIEAADNWLGLLRLELTVNADNAAGLALYRRFGFVIEGRLIGDVLRDGAYIDSYAMARLAGALADRAPCADASHAVSGGIATGAAT